MTAVLSLLTFSCNFFQKMKILHRPEYFVVQGCRRVMIMVLVSVYGCNKSIIHGFGNGKQVCQCTFQARKTRCWLNPNLLGTMNRGENLQVEYQENRNCKIVETHDPHYSHLTFLLVLLCGQLPVINNLVLLIWLATTN